MKTHWLPGVVLVSALGCSGSEGPKVVPVSGVVTLDGKPLAGATVTFSPIAKPGEINAGDGSAGKTNANGEYTLTTSRGVPGAQVGKHRVGISVLGQEAGSSDERRPRGGWPVKEKIPAKYSVNSVLTFEVKADGPNQADFPLTSQ
jgi:hypothetical protein